MSWGLSVRPFLYDAPAKACNFIFTSMIYYFITFKLMKWSISKVNFKYLGIICHPLLPLPDPWLLWSRYYHIWGQKKVQFCIMDNEYLLTDISGSVIFAGRSFAVLKVCCQVDCIFKCAFSAQSSLEEAFRMLEGLGLETGSKDFEMVPCFTVYVIWLKHDGFLSFPLHNWF